MNKYDGGFKHRSLWLSDKFNLFWSWGRGTGGAGGNHVLPWLNITWDRSTGTRAVVALGWWNREAMLGCVKR